MTVDQEAFDEHQKERAELGLPELEDEAEPTIETPQESTETVTTEQEETTTEEVSDKEEKVDYKSWKKDLQDKLQNDYDQKLEKKIEELRTEFSQKKPDEATTDSLEEEIKRLATEKELDPEVLKGIIELARKGVPSEDPSLKTELETLKAEREEREQREIFDSEWNSVLPALQKDFPNASPEQLAAAKAQIDELAHSEKYHEMDMDYVIFKERAALEKTLFSPKKATFESSRPVATDTDSDEFPDFDPNMTPAQFERMEKKRASIIDSIGTPKVRITSRDEGGRAYEREE